MWVTFRGHFSEWALQPKEYIFYTMSIPVYKHLYQNALEGYLKKKKKKTGQPGTLTARERQQL